MQELKPCPFCGVVPFARILSYKDRTFEVCCQNPKCCMAITGPRPTRDAAIAAWNRRTPETGANEPCKKQVSL